MLSYSHELPLLVTLWLETPLVLVTLRGFAFLFTANITAGGNTVYMYSEWVNWWTRGFGGEF